MVAWVRDAVELRPGSVRVVGEVFLLVAVTDEAALTWDLLEVLPAAEGVIWEDQCHPAAVGA
jgi:hypothetical protein